MEDDIKEGFLCPMCMKDLGTAANLQSHFEECHSDDKAGLRQIRGMFGKAKRKIMEKIETTDQSDGNRNIQGLGGMSEEEIVPKGIDPFLWADQEFGASRSKFRMYREIRDAEIDRFVVETNKLLIRLEKLLRSGVHTIDSPMQRNTSRKSLERSLVPWIADSDVRFCPFCKKQFNVARRRHHCRLCGGIMCGKCSVYVGVQFSVSVLKMDKSRDLPRRGKSVSKDDSDEAGIRSCQACMDRLQRYDRQEKEKQTKPTIVLLYEKLKFHMAEAESLHPVYSKMANSISLGDAQYDYEETMQVRVKLIKIYEVVDVISKKIVSLGKDAEKEPSAQAFKLQKGIRAFATGYLQENMFTLPNLPPKDKIKKLQEDRAMSLARRAADEKAEREQAMQQRLEATKLQHRRQGSGNFRQETSEKPTSQANISVQQLAHGGWGPVPIANSSSPDPMLQQMEIIRNYVKQARQENRLDEVEMLERNLMELEEEYIKQQQAR